MTTPQAAPLNPGTRRMLRVAIHDAMPWFYGEDVIRSFQPDPATVAALVRAKPAIPGRSIRARTGGEEVLLFSAEEVVRILLAASRQLGLKPATLHFLALLTDSVGDSFVARVRRLPEVPPGEVSPVLERALCELMMDALVTMGMNAALEHVVATQASTTEDDGTGPEGTRNGDVKVH